MARVAHICRKPPSEPNTAKNVLRWGTGGLNVQACRVGDKVVRIVNHQDGAHPWGSAAGSPHATRESSGMCPANVVLLHKSDCAIECCATDCVVRAEGHRGFFLEVRDDVQLLQWLGRLVTPLGMDKAVVIEGAVRDVLGYTAHGPDTLVAVVTRGSPSPAQVAAIATALRPGGILVVLAPQGDALGADTACHAEDAGLDVRDAILVVEDPFDMMLVPKPANGERHAGLRGGAENEHPTVKARDVMVQVLAEAAGPVLDPFVGSGTTLLAALETGHDATGIEREVEYARVADKRLRHWRTRSIRSARATIASEAETVVAASVLSLDDLFGGGS